jgi:hypothetical protein
MKGKLKEKDYDNINIYPDGIVNYRKIDNLLSEWLPKRWQSIIGEKFGISSTHVSNIRNFRSPSLKVLSAIVGMAVDNKKEVEKQGEQLNNF